MKIKRLIAALVCAAMIVSVIPLTAFSATAAETGGICFSVKANGSTFTITRTSNKDLPAQRVIVRTVDGTALGSIHYTPVYERLDFAAGETTKTITVTEKTSEEIDILYRYQAGTKRDYRFEVLDLDGFLLASASRTITYSSSYSFSNEWIMEHDGERMLYILQGNYLETGWPTDIYHNDKYVDVSFQPSTSSYTVIHDSSSNGYTQGVWTASTDALFSRSGTAPREYLSAIGDKMYTTVYFTGQEIDDGYQYIQILADNSTTCDDKDPDAKVNDPDAAFYKACFEINYGSGFPNSTVEALQMFPVRSTVKPDSYLDRNVPYDINYYSYIYQQKFRSDVSCADNTGAFKLDPTVGSLSVRFNAKGDNDDDWQFKNLKMRIALVDVQTPRVTSATVSQGPNLKHNQVTVTLRFSEIVKQTSSKLILHTSWGDLTAQSLNSSTWANAISFTGEITANAGTAFSITGIEGTVTDLHGLSLKSYSQTMNYFTVGETRTPASSGGIYQLASQSDLYWFADKVKSSRSVSAALTSDINMFSSSVSVFNPMCENGYVGTFDGAGHSIMNLSLKQNEGADAGLFAQIAQGGTVRDLTLGSGVSVSSYSIVYVGGIAGINAGTIEKCVFAGCASAYGSGSNGNGRALGGICGLNLGTVKDCLTGGETTPCCIISYWSDMYVGGIAGINAGNIISSMFYALYNSYSTSNVTRGSVCGENDGTVTNCSGLHHNNNTFNGAIGTGTGTATNVTFPGSAAFFSGEVCYQINGGVTDGSQSWYQTLPSQSLPAFSGDTVYLHGPIYRNTDAHEWSQSYEWTRDEETGLYTAVTATATCTICGETESAVSSAVLIDRIIPTCTLEGRDTYRAAFNGSTEFGFTDQENQVDVPALGHDYSVVYDIVAPTCSSLGYTLYKCSRCDSVDPEHRDPVDVCTHDLTYTVSGNTLTASCSYDPCTMENNSVTLTLNAPSKTVYADLNSPEATLAGVEAFNLHTGLSVSADDIKYYCGTTKLDAAPTAAGSYTASLIVTVDAAVYEITKDYTVLKADPTAAPPKGLIATPGQTLSDVALINPDGNTPGTWTWDDPLTPVGEFGKHTFQATFTPSDVANYKTVYTALTVTVRENVRYITFVKNRAQATGGMEKLTAEYLDSENGVDRYSAVLPPCAFTCTGYVFNGWSTLSGGGTETYYPYDTIILTSDMTLYTQWENAYTVYLYPNYEGGGSCVRQEIIRGGSAELLTPFTREGYVFTGWTVSADGGGIYYAPGETICPEGNITLYAQWHKHEWQFISFVWSADNSTAQAKFECTEDSAHVIYEDAQVTAHYTAAACTADAYTVYVAVYGDHTEQKTVTETGSALGHDIVNIDEKAATCTEDGHSAYYVCSRCGYIPETVPGETSARTLTEILEDIKGAICTRAMVIEGNVIFASIGNGGNTGENPSDPGTGTGVAPADPGTGTGIAPVDPGTGTGVEPADPDPTVYFTPEFSNQFLTDVVAVLARFRDEDIEEGFTAENVTEEELNAALAALNDAIEGSVELSPSAEQYIEEHSAPFYPIQSDPVPNALTNYPALGHELEHVEAHEATADEAGNIEYWHCTRCNAYFADENGENEITQEQTVTPVTKPIVITGQPQNWSGTLGEYPEVRVVAEGEELTYQWYYKDAGRTEWQISSETDDCYDSYPVNQMRNGRELYCVITDAYGNSVETEIATMTLRTPENWTGPVITEQPRDWAGEYGAYPAVSVKAEGVELTYRWYFKDVNMAAFQQSSERDNCYDSYPLSEMRDGRELYCVITDGYGYSVTSETAVMKRYIPEDWHSPVITVQPQNWRGLWGEIPDISVTAEGDGELRYQWYFRDTGKTSFQLSSETDNAYDSYPLRSDRNGRELYVVITDEYGFSTTSVTVTMSLDIPDGYTGPTVVTQPEDWRGGWNEYPDVTFEVEGIGLTYQWYFRDAGKTYWCTSSETDDCYDSYPLTSDRNGRELYCVVTDKYGYTVTSEIATMARFVPEGHVGPQITLQPTDCVFADGEEISVSIAAEGVGLTYQWYYLDYGTTEWKVSSERDSCYNSYIMDDYRNGRQLYCIVTDEYGFSVRSDVVTVTMGD